MDMIKRFLAVLEKTAYANGMDKTKHISNEEELLDNLSYLSKKKSDGTNYLPLHELRLVEKVLNGFGKTAFRFEDKKDVYYEKVGNEFVCCANVYFVRFNEDGTDSVLGHGFCAKAFSQIIVPNSFNPTDAEKVAIWKAQAIGSAKSRALYEAGYGLDFYSDISLEEDILSSDESPVNNAENPTKDTTVKSTSTTVPTKPVVDNDGLPVPQPKKGRPKKETSEENQQDLSSLTETTESSESVDCVADCGNYKGMSLAEIEEIAPKNLVFLMNNSADNAVKAEAKRRISLIPELADKYL